MEFFRQSAASPFNDQPKQIGQGLLAQLSPLSGQLIRPLQELPGHCIRLLRRGAQPGAQLRDFGQLIHGVKS